MKSSIVECRRPCSWSLVVPFSLLIFSSLRGQCAEITVSPGGFQDALDDVSPGDTILLEDGEYWENIKTQVDGTASEPITVRGAGGTTNNENVVLHGAGASRVFEIRHDYYIIEDFTIDGDASARTDSDDIEDLNRDKLIFATADREPTTRSGGYRSALDGLVVRNMRLINAGGECLRLRDFVTFADIYSNHISDCGIYDFRHDDGGKNGEGVYIGTAVDQWDGENWSDGPDECQGNVVRQNYIKTRGNEGVDIKEGTFDTLVEDNSIYMQFDDDSGGVTSRGDQSIIRNNYIEDTDGAGVRLGGYEVDDYQYGVNNEVYGNTLVECRHSGVKVMASPQGRICGNTIELPSGEDADEYEYSSGDFKDDFDPRASCGTSSDSSDDVDDDGDSSIDVDDDSDSNNGGDDDSDSGSDSDTSDDDVDDDGDDDSDSSSDSTCLNGIQGIDGSGRYCCPTGCNQCGGSGCSSSGAANGLGEDECCISEVRDSGLYCDDTGEAPCIYGSSPSPQPSPQATPAPVSGSTCDNGFAGIDGYGNYCCPTGCNQCGGSGCSTSGAENGLGGTECCIGSLKTSGLYCDDTGTAPCIYGSSPSPDPTPSPESGSTCDNGLPGIDASGSYCCPVGCNQCGGIGCSTSGAENGLGGTECCVGHVKSSGLYCDDTGTAPCIYGASPSPDPTPSPESGSVCNNGLPGIDGSDMYCCPVGCNQCGGVGCGSSGAENGLSGTECCIGSVKSSGLYCDDTGAAPCIYGDSRRLRH